jgi:hypothetical protein
MSPIAEQLDETLQTLEPAGARSLESRVRQAIDRDALRRQFEALRDEWKAQSEFLSSTTDMALLWPYQSIIGMGADVVPLILDELARENDHWFWALKAITKADPVKPEDRGNVHAMAEAWLDWGREQGLIDEVGVA